MGVVGGGDGGGGGGRGGGGSGEGGGGRACFMYVRWLPARCVPVHDLTAEQVNQIAPSLARDLTTMSPMQRALASQRRRHSGLDGSWCHHIATSMHVVAAHRSLRCNVR